MHSFELAGPVEIPCFWVGVTEELNPYKRLNANCIRGHVSNCKLYRARFHQNIPVHGMELMLMPEYYHDYLVQKFPGY
jgi:hypothetical protein